MEDSQEAGEVSLLRPVGFGFEDGGGDPLGKVLPWRLVFVVFFVFFLRLTSSCCGVNWD